VSAITKAPSKRAGTYPDLPKAIVVRRVLVPARPRLGYSRPYHLLVVECPFCSLEHMHGDGGHGPDASGSYGDRSPHCPDPYRVLVGQAYPAGYEIVLGETVATEVAA
jgi:hypothetical protein